MNKKSKKLKKFRKIKDEEVTTLYYTASKYLIPRLRKFNKICISYPYEETPQSWHDKIEFIATSFEARINDNFYELKWDDQAEIKQNADKAAKLLGEIWFDLWS